jgi:hypothetical protein
MKKLLQQPLINTVLRLILAAQTVIALAWLGDIIKEGPESRIYFLDNFSWFFNIVFAILLIIACTSLFVLVQKMHKKVNYRRINYTVKPHKSIIFFVSTSPVKQEYLDDRILFTGIQHGQPNCTKEVILTGNIKTDIESIDSFRIPFQQVLRGIAPHIGTVQAIVFIAFDDDTRRLADAYSNYINMFIHKSIKTHSPRQDMNLLANIENIEGVENAVKHAISLLKKSDFQNQDIIIDITGGTKPASIAGVLATVDMPDLEFQYVSSKEPYNITSFDLLNTIDTDAPY